MPKPAVAIFVKTPGLSRIKTRLAVTIGEKKALEFYRLSCLAITQTLTALRNDLDIYWAVAESKENLAEIADPWKTFPHLYQGEGELGDRLAKVYEELLGSHPAVLLIGADAPQLRAEHFLETLELLKSENFVLGRAMDGGFYLFGGQRRIPSEIWTSVPYSSSQTSAELVNSLSPLAKVLCLKETLRDVDDEADLCALADYLPNVPRLSAQNDLLDWWRAWAAP